MARTCIFCGGRAGSREHIFPDWINRVFERLPAPDVEEPAQWGRGTIDLEAGTEAHHKWTGDAEAPASEVTSSVCHDCNAGWMSKLEGRSAPLLAPMIEGYPTHLTMSDQITVATWTAKTAIVLESTLGGGRQFRPDQRRHVMDHDSPPGLLRIMAAAVEGQIPPLGYRCVRAHIPNDGLTPFDLHIYTLQVHLLVLQILRPDPPPPNYGALKTLAVPRDIEIPVFPPTDGFFWPPEKSFDTDGLSRYGARVVSGPLPWEAPY